MKIELVDEIYPICTRNGMMIFKEPKCLLFPEGEKSRIKFFENLEDLSLYAAYRVSIMTGARIPDHIHNRIVLECGGGRFSKMYIEAVK